ncbi:MAG: hypothetical protein JXA01_06840 [Dehalococcoidia bacterium]|nr:hypothetical protein [Dehalococcoidia bacterium]
MNKSNPARTTSRTWWIITAVFFVLTFLPFAFEGTPFSIVIAVISLIMVITGFIVALVYGGRAGKIDSFIRGEGLLAHWTYTPEQWTQYIEKEATRNKESKRALLFIAAGIALAVGVIYAVLNPLSSVWTLSAVLGLIIVIGFTAWSTGWYDNRENKQYQGEAYLAKEGLYFNRRLHLWKQLGSYLNSVEYVEDTPPLLKFSYFALTGTITQEYEVHVPVPKGQEARAKELLEEFNKDKVN